ncbi:hypothetical protein Tco_0944605 [Tanacetum coccineum]
MAQQIIPAAQLVPKFQGIGRCSNYAVLQSIPCSPECKIVGPILLDHLLSYALTATADVLTVKTVSKVPDTKDTIRFKLDTQDIVYIIDMFCDTLKLPVETLDNPFVAPVNIEIIESFMYTIGYQGVVDKVSAFYTKFLAQPWQKMFKVFNRCLTTRISGHDQTKISILQLFHVVVNHTNIDYATLLWWDFNNYVFQKKDVIQLEEDYHSIIDDIPLVSVHTMRNVTVQGMLIPDAFLTKEIRAIDDYKEYATVFVNVVVPMNQPQSVVSTQGTHRTTPRAHRTPTLTTTSPQEKRRKQNEKIEKMVEDEEDEESYASEFANSMFNDDDDFGIRIEPENYKKNLEVVDDDEVNDKEKQDENKGDDAEKMDDAAEEKDNDNHTDHILVGTHATGSMETRNEQMQTPIPTPTRSSRKDLSLDKTISKELTAKV